ncbi:MAG: hypothetical protein MK132_06165 [Lentisphaerales bacterium]|nr:hypothetical protein [Lentisphaerales bacterium]
MKSFSKYLLLVIAILVLISTAIAVDIYRNNKLPEFKAEFTEKDIRNILKFRRQVAAEDDTNSYDGNRAAIELGKKLFFDKKLSVKGDLSCASCHDPNQHWTAKRPLNERDIPSLWNAKDRRWLFWDGRSDSLWSQAAEPLENPVEQGHSRTAIVSYIFSNPEYHQTFKSLFGEFSADFSDRKAFPIPAKPTKEKGPAQENWQSMSQENQLHINHTFIKLCKAIAAFEKTIVASPSTFDIFLEGIVQKDQKKVNQLSLSAQRGLKIFIGKGQCNLCHNGHNLTDEEFHFIHLPLEPGQSELKPARLAGAQKLYSAMFNSMGKYSDAPTGKRAERLRYLKIDTESIGHYKTPSLRNVAHTAPYMHNGSFASLREVIDFYSEMENANKDQPHLEKVIQPLHLDEQEKNDLEAFLHALTSLQGNQLSKAKK